MTRTRRLGGQSDTGHPHSTHTSRPPAGSSALTDSPHGLNSTQTTRPTHTMLQRTAASARSCAPAPLVAETPLSFRPRPARPPVASSWRAC
eukprot:4977571-Prymnesium_polylepis.1